MFEEMAVADKYMRVVQGMYEDSVAAVRGVVGRTDRFKVELELYQKF